VPTNVPLQLPEYQSATSPEPTVADNVEEPPIPISDGLADGDVGVAIKAVTVTVGVVPAGPVQPLTVAVTEYTPLAAVVTLPIDGFC